MEEPSSSRPPPAPSSSAVASSESVHQDVDAALYHRSISDDAPSPSSSAAHGGTTAPAPAYTTAKATASSLASKFAFGGRKLLSPLATAAAGVAGTISTAAAATGSAAASATADAKNSQSSKALASSLAGANAAVTDAASAVTSSISYLFTGSGSNPASSSMTPASSSSSASTTASTAASLSPPPAMDAAELEQLEAEYRQVTAQQRMQILEDLVQHRRADWSYIKAMHGGTNYWLNIALLRETQVLAHLGERAAIRRSVQFFYLGLGLGKLMSEVKHAQFLAMDGCQLLEELEFYFASSTVQSMKLMVATSSPTLHEPLHTMEDEALLTTGLEPYRPTIYKWNQRPVFRRLITPSIPFPLDYREVMLSLCDILALVYSKLVEDNTCSENVFLFQAIIRFDEKIKKLVIDPVKKEFSIVAATVIAEELASVRKEFSSSGGSGNGTNLRHASGHQATNHHAGGDSTSSSVVS